MAKKKKILDRKVKDLMIKLDNNHFTAEFLGEVLMELYGIYNSKSSHKTKIQEAHTKVWEIMEAVRKRTDELSKFSYFKYFRVYQELCKELKLDERPAYLPPFQSEEESAKKYGPVLTKEFNSLILAIEGGKLEPGFFLRQGLDELGDLAYEIPFSKKRFSRAKQIYTGVMDFLGSSGIYEGVKNYRQEYDALLGRVNRKNKFKSNSAGIGIRAFAPIREPRRDFRKGLSR